MREKNNKCYDGLTIKKRYVVLSVEVYDKGKSIFAKSIGDHILYRIENENRSIVPYPSTLFQIISGAISKRWVAIQKQNCFKLIPENWSFDGFWESYYNGDCATLKLYENEKQIILLEELTNDEIINAIRTEDPFNLETILLTIIKHKDERFIGTILEYAKSSLQNDQHYYSSKTIPNSLILAFTYLSKFKTNKVDTYFIKYLSDPIQKEKLTEIVNNYFASRS